MPYIGRPLPRREDPPLITGHGRYTDDVGVAGAARAAMVRSPYAHARIVALRTAAAAAMPGVLAVLTAADYRTDGHAGIAHGPNPADAIDAKRPAFVAEAGAPAVVEIPQPPIVEDRVRHVGEIVAVVVAETLAQARDAAERVEIDYEELHAVASALDALEPGAPQLWDEAPGNVCFDLTFGDVAATERAFGHAHLVVRCNFENQRLIAAHMEPRAAIGLYDATSGIYTVIAGNQGVVRYRVAIAAALGVPIDRVEVQSPDVGGAFGARNNLHAEPLLVAWAARRTGRPVRWTSDRSEGFVTDFHGRDITVRAELAMGMDGRADALRCDVIGNVGAHTVNYAPLQNIMRIATGVYEIPTASIRLRGVLTNTTPVAPYRGAGRPEAVSTIERLLDIAARRLDIDRIELRRRNLIPRTALPYRNATGLSYDSGDFAGNMERALKRSDWNGFAARRAKSTARGRLRGIGLGNYIEAPVGAPREHVRIRVRANGTVEIVTGTQSSGQGHETTYAQVVADRLGVPIAAIALVTGDTERVSVGGGTHSDRSMRLVGTLLVETCNEIAARAEAADPDAIRVDVFAFAAALEAKGEELVAEADFFGRIAAHPTGCAVCELEIDPQTGAVQIVRYTSIDDAGQPINPLIVDGQTQGGIAQGIGQALFEHVVYDRTSGQMLAGTFMDYALPRAHDLLDYDLELVEDPTAGNPLRIKGGGEAGVTPAPAATINAICDALSPFGVEHVEMPATPERIWHLLTMGAAMRTQYGSLADAVGTKT